MSTERIGGFVRDTASGALLVTDTGAVTDAQLRASSLDVVDVFLGGEVLADQVGDGTVKTFTFASPVDLLWVRCVGGTGRAVATFGTATANIVWAELGMDNGTTLLNRIAPVGPFSKTAGVSIVVTVDLTQA